MNIFDKPFNYNPSTGKWELELHKAPKFFSAQTGIKLTISPGTPTGESGNFYEDNSLNGLSGSTIEIRYFDNLSGWTSFAEFDLDKLLKKIIDLAPECCIRKETILLANRDRKEIGEI